MASVTQAAPVSKKILWPGWIVSALPILMFTFSSIAKFVNPPGMAEQFNKLGVDPKLTLGLGILELGCTLIYAVPRTAVLSRSCSPAIWAVPSSRTFAWVISSLHTSSSACWSGWESTFETPGCVR